MKIQVADICGENCITNEDGEVLHGLIVQNFGKLEGAQRVELDFTGTSVFASPFFNSSIGELLRDYDREALNEKLVFLNISKDALALLSRVIQNAREYFANPRVREAVDVIRAEKSGDHRL